MVTRLKLAVIIIVIVAVGATVGAVTVGAMRASHRTSARTGSQISPRLRHLFNVLSHVGHSGSRTAAAAASSVPLPESVMLRMDARFGHEPASIYTGGTYATWAVSNEGTVCLVVGAIGTRGVPSGTCSTTQEAESGLMLVTETDVETPVVVGLAPNGNTSVDVTNADGATEKVPVINNVYEITTGKPTNISLAAASGSRVVRSIPSLPSPPPSAPTG
jgi:hypothetical protein